MKNKTKTSSKSLTNDINKDTNLIQLEKVFKAFFESPKTMKEADFSCGVMRESICRYVKTLKEQNQIALLKKRYCTRTNHIAGEYTTDKKLFPQNPQLNLFEQ